ncbi:MAG: chromate efflux transporter, partial [Alphaproteobacteria bacterium]|nr:chromate efflux transporter [Alphaproteobacteria bacterium]
MSDAAEAIGRRGSALEVFAVFLRLGCTSFGGPIAHLGYLREEIVVRRRWLDDRAYADIVALAQFLPGPASSQAGMAIGLGRAGLPGALAAWLGFTLPSAVLMVLFAYGVAEWGGALGEGWLQGLKTVAVAIVAQAIWGMARNLCPDRERAALAAAAVALVVAIPGTTGQLAAIAAGALAGAAFLRGVAPPAAAHLVAGVDRPTAVACLALFVALLVLPPLVADATGAVALFEKFYRAGSLVFGGGHVVLPLLQSELVEPGWIHREGFVAGYGAAQAVPGPLFTFAAYLGAAMGVEPNGL